MKHFLFAAILFACSAAQAQTDTSAIYTQEKLAMKTKLELTELYLNQVTHVLSIMPRTALNVDDAPKNKLTESHWKAVNKSTKGYSDTILEKYKDIIPYADKENIIDAIMWLQEITLQMESI